MRCSAAHLVGIAVLLGATGVAASPRPCLATPAGEQPASKGVPRTLIDRRLQEHPVQLMGIDGATITYTDSAGLVRKESRDEFLAMLPQAQDAGVAAATALRPPSVVELVDGQRFAGALGAIPTTQAAPAETIAWDHPTLGTIELKLDHIRRLQVRAGQGTPAPQPAQADSDAALLTNGDRAEGLVEGILAEGPTLRLSAGNQSRDIPFERIQEIRFLSNPGAQPPADAPFLWLRDGSVVACRSIRTERTGDLAVEVALRESPGGGGAKTDATTLAASGIIPLADVLAADLHPGALVPLASIAAQNQKPTGDRRWAAPVSVSPDALLRLADVELPGPMSAEWELPSGATRFSADAELPRSDWDWGDAELTLTLLASGRETELFRQRLSADHPRVAINTALPASAGQAANRLRIRVDAGPYGPVQDRVVLRRPVVLVDQK
jgi:hypothetical protein